MTQTESQPLAVHPDFAGKTALVTGASAGIGLAVAEALEQQGATVRRLARNSDDLACDLSDPAAIEAAIALAGPDLKLDYLVNVAGIDPMVSLEDGDAAEFDRILNLNLRGYYLLIRAALPALRRGEGKAIVNTSSINYRLGLPGRSIYSASKAGILGLTTGLARELGREGIRINTVTPGWVMTERQLEEYFSDPAAQDKNRKTLFEKQSLAYEIQASDIASHILFYLSNASRASTGHNCVVDGGWLLE